MKKMFAKIGIPSLMSVVFLLGGLFFSVNTASAQHLNDAPQNGIIKLANGKTWKTSGEAMVSLESAINNLGQAVAGNPNGTLQLQVEMKVLMSVRVHLENGQDVPSAAATGYYEFAPKSGVDGTQGATAGIDWQAIYNNMLFQLSE